MKARMLHRLGVEAMITQPFTPEFAQIACEDFLPWLKQRAPQLAAVYVGENFRFGRGRKGDIALLVAEGRKHGLTVFSAPRVNFDGEPISSTRIRGLLESGDVAGANALLGYTYFAEGPVVHGKHLGRTIGFPTLNLAWAPDLRPRYGVYVVRVAGAKSVDALPGVANYGLRPTVEQAAEPRLEVHVLGDCPFWGGGQRHGQVAAVPATGNEVFRLGRTARPDRPGPGGGGCGFFLAVTRAAGVTRRPQIWTFSSVG